MPGIDIDPDPAKLCGSFRILDHNTGEVDFVTERGDSDPQHWRFPSCFFLEAKNSSVFYKELSRNSPGKIDDGRNIA